MRTSGITLPQLGRFMTPDPYQASRAGGDLSNPQSWNRYAYVRGDPINYYDPRGLFEVPRELDPGPGGLYDFGGGGGGSVGQGIPIWVLGNIFTRELADLGVGWGYAEASLNFVNVFLPQDVFQVAFLPQLAGAGTAGGTIILAGGPISWAAVGTLIVVTAVGVAAVYAIGQVIQASKADIRQNRAASRQVAREQGCRPPTDDDYEHVHEIIKDQKGPDGKVSYEVLLNAWRQVLCNK